MIVEVKSESCCRVSVYTGVAMLCQIVDLDDLLLPGCSSKCVCILTSAWVCVDSVWSFGSAAQIQIIYTLTVMKHTLTQEAGVTVQHHRHDDGKVDQSAINLRSSVSSSLAGLELQVCH